ncbi:pyridoxal phosphate-dependent aminotransferase [Halomonas sp. V046]|uniref:pyridoxal phosphate-dependent aminotransferase n=1 Tax=Halomonas sp. V046 TaxID=3459611 RepID=UPI004043C3A3
MTEPYSPPGAASAADIDSEAARHSPAQAQATASTSNSDPHQYASPWPLHGGQGEALLRCLGVDPSSAAGPFVDLSASLNPLGPPTWFGDWLAGAGGHLWRYPDPRQPLARAALAAHHGVAQQQLWLTNGGAEAIHLVAQCHRGGRALIVEPTFGEYARACALNDISVSRIMLQGDDFRLDVDALCQAMTGVDLVFLCRPNNPTGTLARRDDVATLLRHARRVGALLVVDEAFAEFSDEDEGEDEGEDESAFAECSDDAAGDGRCAAQGPLCQWLAPGADTSVDVPLVLLRSLTKFYTLPGLRLGYVMASAARIRALAERQVAWSLNGLAEAVVPELLADGDFAEASRGWLADERDRLCQALRALGLVVPESRANFVLLRLPGAATPQRGEVLLRGLARHAILGRHTHTFRGLDGAWVRLALSTAEVNDRVVEALADIIAAETVAGGSQTPCSGGSA